MPRATARAVRCARRKAETDFASDCITSLNKGKRVYAVGVSGLISTAQDHTCIPTKPRSNTKPQLYTLTNATTFQHGGISTILQKDALPCS